MTPSATDLVILAGFLAASAGCGLRGQLIAAGILQPSAQDLLARKGFTWHTAETPHFSIHYEPNSFAEANLSRLRTANETALVRVLGVLGEASYPHTVHVFAVENRSRMNALIGLETNGISIYKSHVVCYVVSEKTWAAGAHELLHVVVLNQWGKPTPLQFWLNEGLAVYSDDQWKGYALHPLSRHLQQTGRLLPLKELTSRFNAAPSSITYPQAGSFVRFLYETYGMASIKRLWQEGLAAMTAIYGLGLADLEREWHVLLLETDSTGVEY